MFIRIAGIHAQTPFTERVQKSAAERGVEDPWRAVPTALAHWSDWWEGTAKAKGQTPSEMFLWFLVQVYRRELNKLLGSADAMKHLPISFRGTTEEALDIFCAQLHYTDNQGGPAIFPTYEGGLEKHFTSFATWIETILSQGLAGVSVDKYKQVALLIGAATELQLSPQKLSNDAWDAIGEFIRSPRKTGAKWLTDGYPEPKGRWSGAKGQFGQCEKATELLEKIIASNPKP
jgi:hypothetical protein